MVPLCHPHATSSQQSPRCTAAASSVLRTSSCTLQPLGWYLRGRPCRPWSWPAAAGTSPWNWSRKWLWVKSHRVIKQNFQIGPMIYNPLKLTIIHAAYFNGSYNPANILHINAHTSILARRPMSLPLPRTLQGRLLRPGARPTIQERTRARSWIKPWT